MLDDNRLVRGVSSVADGAHPIKRRYAKCGGEVAVRSAARRCFFQNEAEFSCEGACLFEQGNCSSLALHWRTVDSTADDELAIPIGDLETTKQFFYIRC